MTPLRATSAQSPFPITTPSIYFCLQYRDKFSIGAERERLGLSAFHWSVLITHPTFNDTSRSYTHHTPAPHYTTGTQLYTRFDVTDGIILDPSTGADLNLSREWVFRRLPSIGLGDIVR